MYADVIRIAKYRGKVIRSKITVKITGLFLDKVENVNSVHVSVMLEEVVDFLNPRPGNVYIDGTLGGGGHSEAMARRVLPDGMIVSMDRDLAAIDRTEKRLHEVFQDGKANSKENPFPIRFVHANYRYFDNALDLLKIDQVDGFLLDLGLSSDQLADRRRGFSFESDGPLDLRFDDTEGPTAAELLTKLREDEIADLIYQYGEERFSRRIARQIVERNQAGLPIKTAAELAELVRRCVPKSKNQGRMRADRQKQDKHGGRLIAIDPATRTFQALRIAVNDELGSLQSVLENAPKRMKPGAVMAVISFHSLEDRIVKQAFRDDPRWEVVTKKPVLPSDKEIERNPRSRSAKLRVAKIV